MNFTSTVTQKGTSGNDLIGLTPIDSPLGTNSYRAHILQAADGNDTITQSVNNIRDAQHNFIDGGNGIDTFKFNAASDVQGGSVKIDTTIPTSFTLNGAALAVQQPQIALRSDVDPAAVTYLSGIEKIIISPGMSVDAQLEKTSNAIEIVSGLRDDSIRLGTGNDIARAGAGSDTIIGGDGNDKLYGESGNDKLVTGNGNDYAHGGAGDDRIHAYGTGNDALWGGDGNDEITGGTGNDVIVGGKGNDILHGDEGRDTFYWASSLKTDAGGKDLINGGRDFDTVTFAYAQTGIQINHDQNGDLVAKSTVQYFAENNLTLLRGVESVIGSAFGDQIDLSNLNSGENPNTISAGAGSDTVILATSTQAGVTSLSMGAGSDSLIIFTDGQRGEPNNSFVMVNDYKASETDTIFFANRGDAAAETPQALAEISLQNSIAISPLKPDMDGNPTADENAMTNLLLSSLNQLDITTKNAINANAKDQISQMADSDSYPLGSQPSSASFEAVLSITDSSGKVFLLSATTDMHGNLFSGGQYTASIDLVGVVTTGAGMELALI